MMSPVATIADLKSTLEAKGVPYPSHQRIVFRGLDLEDDKTLREYSVTDNDILNLFPDIIGAKSAIYLLSPTQLNNVYVEFELSPYSWTFNTLYRGAYVSWQVSVKPDGTLKNTATDIDCNCLVWEAEAWIERSSAVTEAHFFNPRNPLAYFADNCVLSFDNFVPYLYRALASLTLTSAMRTEMVVYWLPKFQSIRSRGLQIAFNFIPQTDFEKAGKLTVTPGPSSVARVFLVFRGVVVSKNAENHAELDALDWPSKIGIDVEGMMNQSKFRVMEWGGMEVNMG
ncbi:hypothetical protein BDP81DRAFT_168436 [Colletotrichum phormii]|uniref:Ubiquitin-like domain-containing protein n=1 Tax=Colletotrichum phormii TaxID=359342 RepID=A0AAJ0E9S6_9PEZI|nr:uncharacterized protein BDP81DRAFT_168436 [Colletotrichum phormii]KAK1622008.1 hypothetical protein BDP81DRAFT_168436 [Colletotrichum phormii]